VEAVARTFLGESDQVAPLASAIKVSGQVLHRALRKGKDVVAPSRRVRLDEVRIHALRPAEIDLSLRCGKGFYVRALGRDLAHALGTVGHLTALRRTHNGSLAVDDAVATDTLRAARIDEDARRAVTAALMPLAEAVRGFTTVTLTDEGVLRARHGKTLRDVDVQERASGEGDVIIGRNAQGGLVALLRPHEEGLVVVRGFLPGV
jgi:tRNA pseudouridine55 synthase